MTDDIVKRLRMPYIQPNADSLYDEAADEIERLRKDLSVAVFTDSEYCKVLEVEMERLRQALHIIANDYVELSQEKVHWQRDEHIKIARKALEK